MLELLFLLLPVAAGYGWIMGRNSVRQIQRKHSSILSRHYYKGLNFLLSDQPDKAVDTLIKMINVNNDTAETHIAMGNFFRHRGELDRAIKVHQNLVSRDELPQAQKEIAMKELGGDYIIAGFLGRAEDVFLKLLDSEKHFLKAQQQLFNIYQTTKEWDRAIKLAEGMIDHHGDSEELCQRIAHFYCEQAQLLLKERAFEQAETSLQKAVTADEHAVRPWLMLSQMAMEQQDHAQAIEYLKEIPLRDISWLSEAVPLLQQCAEHLNDQHELEAILQDYWQQCATAYLAKVKLLSDNGEKEQATQVLLEQLRKAPTMKGFKTLMAMYIEQGDEQSGLSSLKMVKDLIEEQIKQRPKYRCVSCGFSGRRIHWLCPSCKKWGSNKPIKGLDGE